MKKFFLILFLFSLLHAQDMSQYYEVCAREIWLGYIERQTEISSENSEKICKTFTYSHSSNPQVVIEKTIKVSEKIKKYCVETLTSKDWEQVHYTFEDAKVTIQQEHNGKIIAQKQMTMAQDCFVMSDYFSLLPLLQKSQRIQSIFLLDPKEIKLSQNTIFPKKLTIYPQGERKLQDKICSFFFLEWEKKKFSVWLDSDNLIQWEEPSTKASISLVSPEKIKKKFPFFFPKTLSNKKLDFLEKQNSYALSASQKNLGTIAFQHKKLARLHQISAQGKIKSLKSNSTTCFESTTLYTENWNPLYYCIQEGNIFVECDFCLHGVVARIVDQEQKLARFVTLPPNAFLIDNNGIQHFAVLLAHQDLSNNAPFFVFHPRRLQSTQAFVSNSTTNKEEIFFQTPHHKIKMKCNSSGELVYYLQGKLKIKLQKQ